MVTRTTNGVVLPDNVAANIWADAQEASAVMRLATRMPLPGTGVSVPLITGDATAEFVNEGAAKPVSEATYGSKVITPYKIAVIQTFTDEFRRDVAGLYNALAERLPGALAQRFDEAVFHGPVPGSGFDTLADADAEGLDSATAFADLAAIDGAIAEANGVNSGWALSPRARGVINVATDGNGRALFDYNAGTLLGSPVALSRAVYRADGAGDDGEVLGFAGDWSQAFYGTVEGVKVKMSEHATVGGVNLFERNMFALLAEIEVGFAVRDLSKFRKIVGANTVA